MDIFVDDRPSASALAAEAPLAALVEEVKCQINDTDRIVVGITCDGIDLGTDTIEKALCQPVSAYERIDLRTAERRAVLRDALTSASNMLDATEIEVRAIVEQLARGDAESAVPRLGECCRSWGQVHAGVCNVAEMLGTDLERFTVDGQPLHEVLAVPIAKLRQIKEAVEAADFVMLGDVLAYELADALTSWRRILATLSDHATADDRCRIKS